MNSSAKGESLLKIASCSYEGSLFGWDLVNQSGTQENVPKKKSKTGIDSAVAENESLETVMSYGLNVCEGLLKAVAISQRGKHLVTGGTDERIRIFDLKENRAVGEISTHTGAITSLHFFGDSYLMSGSEDCTLCIWRVHDWQCVHILGGHKGAVLDFSIHPTGKLALSVSKDSTMKLWNLVQGRCAFTRRLKKPADSVLWHESGLYYSLTVGNEVQLYLASDNSCVCSVLKRSRINKALFTKVNGEQTKNDATKISSSWRIAVVCEDKSLSLFSFDGVQTATVDLSVLGIGRPRDMWSGGINASAAGSQQMAQGIAGHCIVVVTSTGLVLTLNAGAMELSTEGDSEGLGVLGNCLLSHYQIKVEPRLTSVVAWSAATKYVSDGVEDVVSATNVNNVTRPAQAESDEGSEDDEKPVVKVVGPKKSEKFSKESKTEKTQNKKKRKLDS